MTKIGVRVDGLHRADGQVEPGAFEQIYGMSMTAQSRDAGAHPVDGPVSVVIDAGRRHHHTSDGGAGASGALQSDVNLFQSPSDAGRRGTHHDQHAVRDFPGQLQRQGTAGRQINRQVRTGRFEFDFMAAEFGRRAAKNTAP